MTNTGQVESHHPSFLHRVKSWLGPLTRIPTPVIFVGSVGLALLVLWFQGSAQELADAIRDANWSFLLIAAPIYMASLALLCVRWHLLVVMAQGHSNLPRASEAFLTSVVINYAAPIGLAVPSRAALTKRALGLDAKSTGTIAIWEIGLDVIVLGLGTLLWLGIADGSGQAVFDELSGSMRAYALAGIVLAVLAGITAWWFLKTADRRARIFSAARRVLMAPADRPGVAVVTFLATAAYWIAQGVVLAILLVAFHVDVTFELVLGITSVPILVGMLSPIPGGAVVREALMYAVARLAGVPGGPVIAAALVYRFALFAAIPILYAGVRWWISSESRNDGDVHS
ncbi:MAG TPA: lysylphosphatidylglycerol synthase transmembrane domain-containing protein [Thermomicrobiales bacterium]|nr:lysylphosphatidylglycerol synthase transmembrane domain-containing protein [Thermomicrobiales bacterium]